MGRPNEPHPGNDLTTQRRSAYTKRFLELTGELDTVVAVATAKLARSDIDQGWLRALAASDHGGVPDPRLVRWINTFNDEIEVLRRARSTVLYSEPLDDSNLAAAVEMGELVFNAARKAGYLAEQEAAQAR